MKSLFNINQEYDQLIDALMDNGGEVTPELEEALKINAEELETKLHNYHYAIKHLEGNILVVKEEIERLKDKTTSASKIIDKLKEVIKNAILKYGKDKPDGKGKAIKYTDLHLYTVAQKKIVVTNEEAVPNDCKFGNLKLDLDSYLKLVSEKPEYQDSKYEVDISVSTVKSKLDAGIEVPGVMLQDDCYVTRK